jgi:meiotically up-regulated gene 157 (Mug157) protein
MPAARPQLEKRAFRSVAVDALLEAYAGRFSDENLGTLFANALPNTLDTTVLLHTAQPQPDSFVITGDIPASWLRDSANQVWPYLRFVSKDPALASLVAGVVRRSAANVLRAPYANAFNRDDSQPGGHADDLTKPDVSHNNWVFESKWELDSLSNVLRLSSALYNETGDSSPFDADWLAAVRLIIVTFRAQQRSTAEEDAVGGAPYTFQRLTHQASDTLLHGRGNPASRTGMIKSAFRASDDSTVYAFNIPENAFAAVSLDAVGHLLYAVGQSEDAAEAHALAAEVREGIAAHGMMDHPLTRTAVYAYETDGYGNKLFMDDANVPSLLSMPYYGWASENEPLYLRTRAAVLSSTTNPYFFAGRAGDGVGGPHVGWPYIWPLSIITRAWTSTSDDEVAASLALLLNSSACTGFMHESFHKDDVSEFTRPWFAWANSFFGDLILKIADERPHLIFKTFA